MDFVQCRHGALAHGGLLYTRERNERLNEDDGVVSTADEGSECAELLCHNKQHLVVVVEAIRNERNELEARTLRAERGGCRGGRRVGGGRRREGGGGGAGA